MLQSSYNDYFSWIWSFPVFGKKGLILKLCHFSDLLVSTLVRGVDPHPKKTPQRNEQAVTLKEFLTSKLEIPKGFLCVCVLNVSV